MPLLSDVFALVERYRAHQVGYNIETKARPPLRDSMLSMSSWTRWAGPRSQEADGSRGEPDRTSAGLFHNVTNQPHRAINPRPAGRRLFIPSWF